MKKFAYFPGCSLEKLALSYNNSSVETSRMLGVELQELEDWNCCGATTYFHVDQLLAYTLVARNLAMAEKEGLDLVAPCSACYKNAYFTNKYIKEDADLAEHINYALEEDDLQFRGKINVHHVIEVYANEIGVEEVAAKVTNPLEGLRVAPYYGCQIVRPKHNGMDSENPQFFEALVSAMGAEAVDFPERLRCCGGSLIMTSRHAALDMVRTLLQSAVDCGTDVIATACPLCQVNLECYQLQVNDEFGTNFKLPVLYFTQLLGLAMGLPPKKIGIGSELVSAAPFFKKYLSKQVS
ncbi:MAG: CoB--CoM heterodisulfide reductase iron-sulfur subunit B family protein [Anaerolineae bacterium]|nr:CoB--CoM heterodisulfide reductase iron-sulfur subunit B family protein [Anaerolineae bacterium]